VCGPDRAGRPNRSLRLGRAHAVRTQAKGRNVVTDLVCPHMGHLSGSSYDQKKVSQVPVT